MFNLKSLANGALCISFNVAESEVTKYDYVGKDKKGKRPVVCFAKLEDTILCIALTSKVGHKKYPRITSPYQPSKKLTSYLRANDFLVLSLSADYSKLKVLDISICIEIFDKIWEESKFSEKLSKLLFVDVKKEK